MIVQELHHIQREYGCLPEDQLRALAARIKQPLHRLHEVASFFPHYQLQPAPAVAVKVCCDMACHLAGGESLCRHLEEAGKQAPGQVSVKRVSCLGRCDGAPTVCINERVYWNKSRTELENLVQTALARQPLPRQVTDKPAPRWQIDPYGDRPRYEVVRRWAEAWQADNDADPGRKRVRLGDPILKILEEGNLRGMGGAAFPTFRKWATVRGATGEAKYVVCNGDESEPGTFKDRDLLIFAPHLLVEGITIAGLVSGAERGYIYIRHEYEEQIEAVRAEIARAAGEGFCGGNILGTGIALPLEVFVSPGGYICGEEVRCSRPWKTGGPSRGTSRRFRSMKACMASRPSSTMWKPSPGSLAWCCAAAPGIETPGRTEPRGCVSFPSAVTLPGRAFMRSPSAKPSAN